MQRGRITFEFLLKFSILIGICLVAVWLLISLVSDMWFVGVDFFDLFEIVKQEDVNESLVVLGIEKADWLLGIITGLIL